MGGTSAPIRKFGPKETKAVNTVYQAGSDGIVKAYVEGNELLIGYCDTTNPPGTVVGQSSNDGGAGVWTEEITMPVRKGEYWKVTTTSGTPTIYWWPIK